jgi:hypothetical protein
VPRTLLRILEEVRQPPVERPLRARRKTPIRDGREERVVEPDPVPLEHEHPVLERRLEHPFLDELQRRLPEGSHRRERLLRLGREALEPLGEEALEIACDRELVGRRLHGVARLQRACKLEREERIAVRLLVDATKRRPRKGRSESTLQQAPGRPEAQRAEREPLEWKGALELGRQDAVDASARAFGHQHAEPNVGQATKSEGERGGARRVEPLDVVDGDEQRTLPNERAQRREERDCDRAPVGRWPASVLEQERDCQRPSLHRRQTGDDIMRLGEQIREHGERQPPFGFGRPRKEYVELALTRRRDCSVPHSRLADARVAVQQERRSSVVRPTI